MLVVAHRGDCRRFPENTAGAFTAAIKAGAAIELDVRICRGGEAIIMHDARVNRTTNGRGWIRRKTLSQLKQLTCGSSASILTLAEALAVAAAANPNCKVIIELKDAPTAKVIHAITNATLRPENIIAASFFPNWLRAVQRQSPATPTFLFLPPAVPPALCLALASHYKIDGIITRNSYRNTSQINRAHQSGLQVFAWATASPASCQAAARIGFDGVLTNFPREVLENLNN